MRTLKRIGMAGAILVWLGVSVLLARQQYSVSAIPDVEESHPLVVVSDGAYLVYDNPGGFIETIADGQGGFLTATQVDERTIISAGMKTFRKVDSEVNDKNDKQLPFSSGMKVNKEGLRTSDFPSAVPAPGVVKEEDQLGKPKHPGESEEPNYQELCTRDENCGEGFSCWHEIPRGPSRLSGNSTVHLDHGENPHSYLR